MKAGARRHPASGHHTSGRRTFWIALGGLAGVLTLGWLGLQVPPGPYPETPLPGAAPRTVPIPDDLPTPVARFFRETYGTRIPAPITAVISGRARVRPLPGGPTLPARFRFTHRVGQDYAHDIEATWFGLPILRVREAYLDGVSHIALPWGREDGEPKDAQAANLGLWSESIWMPGVYLADPRVRWTAVDRETALLTVPFGAARETYTVRFDPASGRPTVFESMRYKSASAPHKTVWLNEIREWAAFDGALLPSVTAARWLDDARPWAEFRAERVVYDSDVDAALR